VRLWKRERVADGPPARWVGCTSECRTRWNEAPQHSAECQRRAREASERVAESIAEASAQLDTYLAYRERPAHHSTRG
jgi:hypothetical protein